MFCLAEARKHFVKALLHPCSYTEDFCFCGQQYKDKLDHLLRECPLNPGFKKLHRRLSLYNFPTSKIYFRDRTLVLPFLR